jgi:hypothetical protein
LHGIEHLFQSFFRRPGVELESNAPPYRVPYTSPPPYPQEYGGFLEITSEAHYRITHGVKGRAAEFGRNMWDLMNEKKVELLFAIQIIWRPVYKTDELEEDDEAREE